MKILILFSLFLIFGTTWFAYIFHGSIFNGILSVSTFVLLRKFNLEKIYSFFYSLCFSVTGYTISGTPFVDLHSIFFSLLAIYFFIFAILDHKKIYWFFIPIFLGIAFFSKQTPAGYVIFLLSILILIYILKNKNIKIFYYLLASTFLFLFLIIFIFYVYKINLDDFFLQFFLFPGEIAKQRLNDLHLDIKNSILKLYLSS